MYHENKTRLSNIRTRSEINEPKNIGKLDPSGLTDQEIERIFAEICNKKSVANGPVIIPVSMLFDFSGSMDDDHEKLIKLAEKVDTLRGLNKVNVVLIISVIYRSQMHVIYAGEIAELDTCDLINALPNGCYGTTPLADAFNRINNLFDRLESMMQNKRHTIPINFAITDSESTEDDADAALEPMRKKIMNGEMLCAEFITSRNDEGLRTDAYKIQIDSDKSEELIERFFKALSFASSSVAVNNRGISAADRPNPAEVSKYNKYLSANLLFNFRTEFERNH